jgi:hypothetical protein
MIPASISTPAATNHITSELDKFTMHDWYHGHDQVRMANGTGMHINSIGSFVIPTLTAHFTSIVSFMLLVLRNIWSPFICLILIIIHLLNFTPIFSSQGSCHEEGPAT